MVSSDTHAVNEQVSKILNQTIGSWQNPEWLPFYNTYRDLHRHPGKSGQEFYAADKASNFLHGIKEEQKLSDQDLFIRRNIGGREVNGKPDPEPPIFGPSVVGVFRNGSGPVVLLRADMDALPVMEATGLDYQSENAGVAHACGHDLHTTALMAATRALLTVKETWSGTLIACFQPSEESGHGAMGLIKGGLYGPKYGIPVPNFVFGSHVSPFPSGSISLTRGLAYSESNNWKVTVKGREGHSSMPEAAIDPITMAAYAITRLQTVVSHAVPSKAGVLSVTEIHGGQAENIIPDSVSFNINTRARSHRIAARMKEHMFQIINAEVAASIPPSVEPKPASPNPVYEHVSQMPLLINEDRIANDISNTFTHIFDKKFSYSTGAILGSDDFPVLARSKPDLDESDIPYCYWQYGSTDPDRWQKYDGEMDEIPSNHNGKFHPQCVLEDPDDPLKMAAKALCAAALSKFTLGGK